MPSRSITDAFVRSVKSPNPFNGQKRQITYIDTLERGLALMLVVSYGGTKTFRVMTYKYGRAQTRKLGTYPAMTLKGARAAAKDYYANPEKVEARAEVGTFREIAEEWFEERVKGRGLISAPNIRLQLDNIIYPHWKNEPFLELKRRRVNQLLTLLAKERGKATADACLGVIRPIMKWYQTNDDDYASPIVEGMKRNDDNEKQDRTLSDIELKAVWKAAGECGQFGDIVKLGLLTGQRRKKISTMRWADLTDHYHIDSFQNLDDTVQEATDHAGVWVVPKAKREKGTGGALQLPKMALAIIGRQLRVDDNPFVFVGKPRGRHAVAKPRGKQAVARGPVCFNSWSDSKTELDSKLPAEMPPWNIHDLRKTARTRLSACNVPSEIAERVLGHKKGGVESIYDQFHYFRQKGQALEKLARSIERIVDPPTGNNVVPIKRRRKAS